MYTMIDCTSGVELVILLTPSHWSDIFIRPRHERREPARDVLHHKLVREVPRTTQLAVDNDTFKC